MNDLRRILLLSTSTVFGGRYLDYAESAIGAFLPAPTRVLFVPFALSDRNAYAERVTARFARFGHSVTSLHREADTRAAVAHAAAIFIGGGNTFRLLKTLYDLDVLAAIRERVSEGTPYIGSSAGSNVAGPTIRTTNDMPIVEPPSFDALGLVRFQINPHYVDADPSSTHLGETREERIQQFHEENDTPVIGLREGAMVHVEEGIATLWGNAGARLFLKGSPPAEVTHGALIAGFVSSLPAAE